MSDAVEVPVRSGGEVVAYALVSEFDAADVLRYSWSLTDKGYAQAWIGGKHKTSISMQRFILRLPTGAKAIAHHRNELRLDNRRENLEVLSSQRVHVRLHKGTDSPERQWQRLARAVEYVARRSIVAARHDRYSYVRGCRCEMCLAANREYSRSLTGKTPPTHGNSGYTNYGCRCEVCRAENSAYQRQTRERRKQAA